MRDTIRFDTPITQRQLDALSFISEFIDQPGQADSVTLVINAKLAKEAIKAGGDLIRELAKVGHLASSTERATGTNQGKRK